MSTRFILRTFALSALTAVVGFATMSVTPIHAQGMQSMTMNDSAAKKASTTTIALTTKPAPAAAGDTTFIVMVTGPDKKPVTGADVSVTLQMPAMPAMKMAEMKNTVALKPMDEKPEDAGKYTGAGQIVMAGTWNVTISVKVGSKDVASKKQTLTAK